MCQPPKPKAAGPKASCAVLPGTGRPTTVLKDHIAPSKAAPAAASEKRTETPALTKDAPGASLKRKANDQIEGPPAKKPAVTKAKNGWWLQPGKLVPLVTHKEYAVKDSIGKRSMKGNRGGSAERKHLNAGKVTLGKVDKAQSDAAIHRQEQASSCKVRRGLKNMGNSCFANAVIQALGSVDELRDHLISRFVQFTKDASKQLPHASKVDTISAAAKVQKDDALEVAVTEQHQRLARQS